MTVSFSECLRSFLACDFLDVLKMNILVKNTQIFLFPKRKLISAWLSTVFAWALIILIYCSPINYQELESLPFFIRLSALTRDILTDISILILITNSFLSRYKKPKIYWIILNLPLIAISPFVLIHLFASILFTYIILFLI